MAVLTYLGICFGHSLVHYLYLRQYEGQLSHQIQAARVTNARMKTDLRNLRNPVYVKQMLRGKVLTPRPQVSVPIHPAPGT